MSSSSGQLERGQRTAIVLRKLVVSWARRLTEGDSTRAAIVLQQFARLYNEHRADLLAFARQTIADPRAIELFPRRSNTRFDADTRQAMRVSLVVGTTGGFRTAGETMPETVVEIPSWYGSMIEPLMERHASYLDIDEEVAATSPSALAGSLFTLIERYVSSGEGLGDDPVEQLAPRQYDVPDQLVTAVAPRWQMPTWGWWAIGSGLAVGIGYLSYQMARKEGWV